MASADQIRALLKSHADGDDERFYSVALQVAAHEAKIGHGKLAKDLRDLVDEARINKVGKAIPIGRPRGELANLLDLSYPSQRIGDMVLDDQLSFQLTRVIKEQRRASVLLSHGLSPRRKLLLTGLPGTGKTMTASVLAGELGLPLFQVRLDGLITKFMGETSAKLRQVFDAAERTRGVFFFDEFDAIGAHRGLENDVGESRRILNSFLTMIEQDQSQSLIIAATNHPSILDYALLRRFDDVLSYKLPNLVCIESLLKARLSHKSAKGVSWKRLAKIGAGLSYAEISRAADEALKNLIMLEKKSISEADIREAIQERNTIAIQFHSIPK